MVSYKAYKNGRYMYLIWKVDVMGFGFVTFCSVIVYMFSILLYRITKSEELYNNTKIKLYIYFHVHVTMAYFSCKRL